MSCDPVSGEWCLPGISILLFFFPFCFSIFAFFFVLILLSAVRWFSESNELKFDDVGKSCCL